LGKAEYVKNDKAKNRCQYCNHHPIHFRFLVEIYGRQVWVGSECASKLLPDSQVQNIYTDMHTVQEQLNLQIDKSIVDYVTANKRKISEAWLNFLAQDKTNTLVAKLNNIRECYGEAHYQEVLPDFVWQCKVFSGLKYKVEIQKTHSPSYRKEAIIFLKKLGFIMEASP